MKAVFVRKTSRYDGSYKHGWATGRLVKNIYGGKIGALYFLGEVMDLLKSKGFVQSNGDPCLLQKKHQDNTHTLVPFYSDDHIITATNQRNIDEYHRILSEKYEKND